MIIPTRTLQHPDGRLEIIRVLTGPMLDEWSPDQFLSYEGSLVWLCPLESLDFVRHGVVDNAARRTGRVTLSAGLMVVGYANLLTNAPRHPRTGGFVRRVFYWRPEDLQRNLNRPPEDAVDPATLLPGHEGAAPHINGIEAGYPRHLRADAGHGSAWARGVVARHRRLAYAE